MANKIVRVLQDCTSAATAFLQPDYPYGGLRCQRRVWLEYKAREGFRTVYQTSNPKRNNDWSNKPKLGTYSMLSVLTLTDEHMFKGQATGVQAWVCNVHNLEEYESWMAFFGQDLNSNQRACVDVVDKMWLAKMNALKSSGKTRPTIWYRVTDAETGEIIAEKTTASDPMFAAGVTPSGGNYSMEGIKALIAKHAWAKVVADYNPPVHYIGANHPVGIFESYVLGKTLRVEFLSGGND